MRVEFHPAAQAEAEEAQEWYQARSVFAAAGFLRELSEAIRRAVEAPDRYPLTDTGTRRVMLDRFPFTVFYRIQSDILLVVAIAHQKRRPGYWSAR